MIRITLIANTRRVKKNVERDLSWYDSSTHKMVHHTGGRLEFHYDRKQGRSIPKVINDECYSYENSWNDIQDWMRSKRYAILQTRPKQSVSFEVDDYEWNKIRKELSTRSILYDIEEIEEDNA